LLAFDLVYLCLVVSTKLGKVVTEWLGYYLEEIQKLINFISWALICQLGKYKSCDAFLIIGFNCIKYANLWDRFSNPFLTLGK
jgi:hypothetical protein